MQQEDRTLGAESATLIPHVSHYPTQSLSIADVNSDGVPDLVIGSTDFVILRQS